MRSDPPQRIIEALQHGGFDPRPTGPDSHQSRCPGHDGDGRSLSISKGDDGCALLHCHAHNCKPEDIMRALGMEMRDLFLDRNGTPTTRRDKPATNGKRKRPSKLFGTREKALASLNMGELTGLWIYVYSDGAEAFSVARLNGPDGKTYRPVNPTTEGWRIGDPPGLLPLYHLPELAGARPVYLTEGEKACDAARGIGAVATTSAHGAGSARKSDWRPLAGAGVIILPDHDKPGERHAREAVAELAKLNPRPSIRIVRLQVQHEGDDIVEWLDEVVPDSWDQVRCLRELDALADATPEEDLKAAELESEEREGWPALALGDMPTVEAFPTDCLPDPVAQFVRTVADSIGCPEDLRFLFPSSPCDSRAAAMWAVRLYSC